MTFPLGQTVSTANVASSDSDPSLAREDLLNLITLFNQLLASANLAQGVMVLGGDGKISSTLLPATLTAAGSLTLAPAAGVINMNRVLRLQQTVTADLGTATGTASPTAGDLIYLVDGDGGGPCLGAYDGSNWRVVRLQMRVGDVAAALTSTVTLTATADA
jgi:hypothetical protein